MNEKLNEQLEELYRINTDENEDSMDSISLVIDIIEDRFAQLNGLQLVNEYLGALDVNRVTPRVLVCSLRCAFRARSLMPNWYLLCDVAVMVIEAKGLDAKRLLRGMI